MNEPVAPSVPGEEQAGFVADAASAAVRAGRLLRQAREAAGMHVEALAVSLKVPVAKLQALESGRLDGLPDVTFARALVASICRTLKVDPAPVLADFPQLGTSRLGVEAPAMNTPFRPPGTAPRFALSAHILKPRVLIVGALLLSAAAVFLWPRAAEEVSAPAPLAQTQQEGAAPAQEASAPEVTPAVRPEASAPAAVPAATPALAASAVLAPAPGVPASAAVPSDSMLVLTATEESWVKVTDAKGVVAISRTLKAGEVVAATGVPPLALVVGRVDAVRLQVRGQAFDMTPFAKDRVARFEVK